MHYLPRLLELLKKRDYVPLPLERLAEKLGIADEELEAFRSETAQHLKQGTLVKLKKNRICLPRDADLVTGKIRFRQSGAAILIPDTPADGKPIPALQIRAEDTWVAMHGDHVVCRIIPRRKLERYRKGRGPLGNDAESARVIRILERAHKTLAGTLRKSRMFHFVIPGDPRIIQDILVPDPAESKLNPKPKIDDKVIVKLHEWEQRHLNPEGEIIEVLGKTHTPGAEYKAILHQYDLNPNFPEEVMAEVSDLPTKVPASALRGRMDLRKLDIFTIDPQDAKDFDDALSIEPLDDGGYRVGVHIADVSTYVRSGTRLDDEARKRGNSTYLVGAVIPMLPHALSNGLCSLVEGEDRLTKSVFITYNKAAKPVKTEFANTVIRSRKRLTYEQAYVLLKEDDLEKVRALPAPPEHQTAATGRPLSSLPDAELRLLQESIRNLWSVASRLRKTRMRTGSLDLDMPETKIYVDEGGYADRIVKIEYDESHQLIEEFMLAANESVARVLNRKRIPGIHRVHDKPEAEKLDELALYMRTVGIEAGDLNQKKNVLALLAEIRKHPQAHMLRIQLLRSLKQACYRATADGHYGLGKQHYAHFTSPIRRYSDLIIHRIFAENLIDQDQKAAPERSSRYTVSRLTTLAQHLSITEQNSTEAERESVKLKLLEFFERELAKPQRTTFRAIVLDTHNHGMFVELSESLAYGLVPVSTLTDDLYHLSGDGSALVGRRNRKSYTTGDEIEVVVLRVDRFKRQIDFTVPETNPDGKTSQQQPQKRTANNRQKAKVHPSSNAATVAKKGRSRSGGRSRGSKRTQTQGASEAKPNNKEQSNSVKSAPAQEKRPVADPVPVAAPKKSSRSRSRNR